MSFIEYTYAEQLSRQKDRESLEVLLWSKWVAWFVFCKRALEVSETSESSYLAIDPNPGAKDHGTTLLGCCCPLLSYRPDTAEVPTI